MNIRESDVFDEGVEQGIEQGKLEIVCKMLQKGYSEDDIGQVTGISLEQIEQTKKELLLQEKASKN